MFKTTFRIAKMDCPAEEQLIRMQLEGIPDIEMLEFDIPGRQLTVFHHHSYEQIAEKLEKLDLDTTLVNSQASGLQQIENRDSFQERKLLWQVLAINVFFFLLELITGIIAHSMGLMADSLDMLADSIVYGLALFAVGGTVARKKRIARIAGYFQLLLAVLGLVEVIRRFIHPEEVPEFQTMILISSLALVGNSICLYLLQKSKSREAHIRASMIFTSNDVMANLGVILAGGLVYWTSSSYPDLIIGIIVFLLVARGSFSILQLGK